MDTGNEKFLVIADPKTAAALPDSSLFAEADGAGVARQPSGLPASPLASAQGVEGASSGMRATLNSTEGWGWGRRM